VINHLLTTAPEFDNTKMVGCPLNAILDFLMITQAGLAAFLSPKVNAMLREMLKVWAHFLVSKDSLYVLNTTSKGWLSPEALAKIRMDEFIHDANKPSTVSPPGMTFSFASSSREYARLQSLQTARLSSMRVSPRPTPLR
jgi:Phophatidylserine decarboxylase